MEVPGPTVKGKIHGTNIHLFSDIGLIELAFPNQTNLVHFQAFCPWINFLLAPGACTQLPMMAFLFGHNLKHKVTFVDYMDQT